MGLIVAAAGASALSSCGEDSTIGSSLLEDQVEIIVDSTFTVSGSSAAMTKVQPRTLTQLIGNISIPGYGRIRSTAAAQFLPSTELDTTKYSAASIDSVFLNLRYAAGAFIGDSVVPMGITAYPLEEILSADLCTNSPLPTFGSTGICGTVFAPSTLGNDSLQALTTRTVAMKLPVEFGRSLFNAYVANPEDYANGNIFTNKVFKGLYIDSNFGSGRLMQFARTTITMNMHRDITEDEGKVTTENEEFEYYAVSPELVNNNYITVDLESAITDRIAAGDVMMVAPSAYNARMRFPLPELIESYNAHGGIMAVLNSVSLTLPADTLETGGLVPAPSFMLMVLEKDYDSFFSQNKLPDDKTSFYATYNQTNKTYEISGLSTYVKNLMASDEPIKEEDYTFLLVPVSVSFELDVTASYYSPTYIVSDVQPYIDGPAAAVIDFSKAKVKLTYSRQVAL